MRTTLALAALAVFVGVGIAADSTVVQMEELPVAGLSNLDGRFTTGLHASASFAESRDASWPEVVSAKPVSGSVRLGGSTDYAFLIDESAGTGKGYDRMWFDSDGDGNLKNEQPLAVAKGDAAGLGPRYGNTKAKVVFEPVEAKGAGLRVYPVLLVVDSNEVEFVVSSFVPATVRRGTFELGGKTWLATSGSGTAGRRALRVAGEDGTMIRWWGSETESAIHRFGGKHYTFLSNEEGTELSVEPYTGETGTFAIGPGKRELSKCTVKGSFRGTEHSVPVGGELEGGWPKPATSCVVPVGDYSAAYIDVEYGDLKIFLSNNYHSDGGRHQGETPHPIAIRAGETFTLDFTNPHEVLFASPARDAKVKRGETLEVKAVLIDPKLDIMFRRMSKGGASLDPKVVITRKDGRKVAEGTMPYG